MPTHQPAGSVIAFDVGAKRIGVAIATMPALLPRPFKTLLQNGRVFDDILALISEQHALAVVMGLPRGLDGQETAQTREVEHFGHELEQHLNIPLYWQDEAVTSRQAEEELQARGKPFAKGDIDALAATYILEDFLREHRELL